MANIISVCLTFDVDLADYTETWRTTNEFAKAIPEILTILERYPEVRTTWFIRLDQQVRSIWGYADHFFREYKSIINELIDSGHEIGWHPHCYIQAGGNWKQNVEEAMILEELSLDAPLAQSYGLKCVRMGWGFHTNKTMCLISDLGFDVDSSAIPRPQYIWEETKKDWTLTPLEPYFPSESDYRVPGRPDLSILEVPISVTHVKAPYDLETVLRYINLAYSPDLLRKPLEDWLKQHNHLITITHPYELLPRDKVHGLLAFDMNAFEQNLNTVRELAQMQVGSISFLTISEFANLHWERSHE